MVDKEILLHREEAKEIQRKKQQGLGRSIISTFVNGVRVVTVGKRVFTSKRWITFHDFLFEYIQDFLGKEWLVKETAKPLSERHPIVNWFETFKTTVNAKSDNYWNIKTSIATGISSGILDLAYNLYLIEHNTNSSFPIDLQARLKSSKSFYDVAYECWAAGILIRAGFLIYFENEKDVKRKHCELTAHFSETGKKFSVEAKFRAPYKTNVDIGNQLYEGLKKQADHERVIFIEINQPNSFEGSESKIIMQQVLTTLRDREPKLTINRMEAPPAYVIITNNPYIYNPVTPVCHWAVGDGFKIDNFKYGKGYASLRECITARDSHLEMHKLMHSIEEHFDIPMTFDGEIPEFVYGNTHDRLLIGDTYILPNKDGKEQMGELVSAVVSKNKKVVRCIFKMPDGSNNLVSCPLTEDEFSAYQKHPNTFFGKLTSEGQPINDPLELYDEFLKKYSLTPKEQLLNFLNEADDFKSLQNLNRDEVASIYCERLVETLFRNSTLSTS